MLVGKLLLVCTRPYTIRTLKLKKKKATDRKGQREAQLSSQEQARVRARVPSGDMGGGGELSGRQLKRMVWRVGYVNVNRKEEQRWGKNKKREERQGQGKVCSRWPVAFRWAGNLFSHLFQPIALRPLSVTKGDTNHMYPQKIISCYWIPNRW